MRIAIIMQHFRIHGGNEMLAYSLIEALNKTGIIPDVYTRVNYPGEEESMEKEVYSRFHKKIRINKKTFAIDRSRILPAAFKKNIGIFIALELAFKKRYDFIYDFQEGPIYFFNKGRYLKYCNAFSYDVLRVKKSKSALKNILFFVPKAIMSGIYRRNFLSDRFHKVINSKYSKDKTMKMFNIEIPVVYPGVNTSFFSSSYKGKRSGAVSFGRFADYKRQLEIVKISEKLEQEGEKIIFHIGGGTESFLDYYKKIENYVKNKKLKNVRLYPDISVERFRKIMEKSLIYIHGMHNEPFGITTAEAIACGLIPVTHDSGGQKEIVPIAELRYRKDSEAKDIIKRLSHDKKLCDEYRKKLQKNVKRFDEEKYQREMMRFLKWTT